MSQPLLKPETLLANSQILLAPMMFTGVVLLLWLVAYAVKRPAIFAWGSIIHCAVSATCLVYYLFGVLPDDPIAGMITGLISGLGIAWLGKTLLKNSTEIPPMKVSQK